MPLSAAVWSAVVFTTSGALTCESASPCGLTILMPPDIHALPKLDAE